MGFEAYISVFVKCIWEMPENIVRLQQCYIILLCGDRSAGDSASNTREIQVSVGDIMPWKS
jgi:hypothetical protein